MPCFLPQSNTNTYVSSIQIFLVFERLHSKKHIWVSLATTITNPQFAKSKSIKKIHSTKLNLCHFIHVTGKTYKIRTIIVYAWNLKIALTMVRPSTKHRDKKWIKKSSVNYVCEACSWKPSCVYMRIMSKNRHIL